MASLFWYSSQNSENENDIVSPPIFGSVSGHVIANGMALGAISSEAQVGENILSRIGGLQREETINNDSIDGMKQPKSITGILKVTTPDNSCKATGTLICEESGTQFNTRNLRLFEGEEAKIGRCIRSGALPDEVRLHVASLY